MTDETKVLGYCDQIDALTQLIRDEVSGEVVIPPEPEPDWTVIPVGGDLQAALDDGGQYQLAQTATFEDTEGFAFAVNETQLQGLGENTIAGNRGHALKVGLDFTGAAVEACALATVDYDGSVCRLGLNTTDQVDVARVPRSILLTGVAVLSHRGKRAIEVNAAEVVIDHCDLRDIYAPSKQDSQAILIVNTPGPITIRDCYLEAASENIMVGGDEVKIPDCRPTGLLVERCQLTKPLAWKGNTAIPTKNLFELKDGHDVTIRDCELWNSWKSAQDGYGFMFTPTRGGSLRNVRVENCRMHDVGAICNITGYDSNWPTPHPRTQIEMHGGEYRTNKAVMGGTGRFALIDRGPERVVFSNLLIRHEGSAFIECGSTTTDVLHVLNCDWNYGSYGIRIGGYNHGDNSHGYVKDLKVEGCTITGANSQFRDRYPDNLYVSSMSHDREIEVEALAVAYAREVREELKRVAQWEREYDLGDWR